MNNPSRPAIASSLLATLGFVLGLRKSRTWFLLSTLAGFLLLAHTHRHRFGRCRRPGCRKPTEVEVASASLSQLRGNRAGCSQYQTRQIKEDPGI